MSSKSNSAESAGYKIGRHILTFVLFAVITALCASCVISADCLNSEKYVEIFTNKDYTESLYGDIKQYAYDACIENSIPTDSVDDVVTYNSIYEITRSYAEGNFDNVQEYTQTTYTDKISALQEKLSKSTVEMINDKSIETAYDIEKGSDAFAADVCSYIEEKTQFQYASQLETVLNIGKTVGIAAIAVFALLAIVLSLILFSMGDKKYRGLRPIYYALMSSGILQLAVVIGFEILKKVKSLVIYPSYLSKSVMSFIVGCETDVFVSSIAVMLSAVAVVTVIWKLKHSNK